MPSSWARRELYVLVRSPNGSPRSLATCLMRPTGIDDLTPKSVTKKLKDKAFAAGVDREQVARGLELIGLERAEHIQNVIDGMRDAAEVLGVRGVDLQAGREGKAED